MIAPLPPGLPLRGIPGADIFTTSVVTVDYQNNRAILSNPATFHYAGKSIGLPLAFDAQQMRPLVAADLDGITGHFPLDTGSSGGRNLSGAFIKANPLLEKCGARLRATEGRTVTGREKFFETTEPALTLDKNVLRQVPTALETQDAAAEGAPDGSIGGQILRRFTVTFDYSHQRVYFEPNANYAAPFPRNRSGLAPHYEKTGWVIDMVQAHSPAAAAGLKAGDRITRIDGRDAAPGNLLRFPALTRQPAGTVLQLTARRGKKAREITLILKDYD